MTDTIESFGREHINRSKQFEQELTNRHGRKLGELTEEQLGSFRVQSALQVYDGGWRALLARWSAERTPEANL